MQSKITSLSVLFPLLFLLLGCTNDHLEDPLEVNLAEARLSDFGLTEIAYTEIDITHPELLNNEEVKHGMIKVVVPRNDTQLKLTPKPTNFSSDGWTLTPRMGEMQDFSKGTMTYTLTSKADPNKKVHYGVTVTEETNPLPGETGITAFRFEKSRNPGLEADIAAIQIKHAVGTMGKIYVLLPVGTDLSNLNPSIEYHGTDLFYTQDASSAPVNSTTEYPENGIKVDFSYPNDFYAVVKHSSEVMVYDIIVDVAKPILVGSSAVTTPEVVEGVEYSIQITSITNQGNHPISLSTINHINQSPEGLNVLRAFTAVPSFGLKPGESMPVTVLISAQTYPSGTYQTTAVFSPQFYGEPEFAGFLEEATLTITSTIIE